MFKSEQHKTRKRARQIERDAKQSKAKQSKVKQGKAKQSFALPFFLFHVVQISTRVINQIFSATISGRIELNSAKDLGSEYVVDYVC